MQTTLQGKVLSIELPQSVDGELAQTFEVCVSEWISAPGELCALNFKSTTVLKKSAYRQLITLAKTLKDSGKKLISYNLNPNLQAQIKNDGMAIAINVVANIENYIQSSVPTMQSSTLNVNLINPFLNATITTLLSQAQIECTAQKPFLMTRDEKSQLLEISIAGVITLSTDHFQGSITLAFPGPAFLGIYESMCGEKSQSITPEIEDAAGELLNIIYGTAKTQINEQGHFKLSPAAPTILSGNSIQIRQQTFQKIIILPFLTQFGQFQIEISFESKN